MARPPAMVVADKHSPPPPNLVLGVFVVLADEAHEGGGLALLLQTHKLDGVERVVDAAWLLSRLLWGDTRDETT